MIILLVFIFGLVLGSFLNVCIYRIPLGLSIVSPPSSCPACKNRIKWYDNIPIFSYILLKGKCRVCKSKISPRYPLVELLASIIAILLYLKFGLTIEFGFFLVYSYCLLVLSFIDMDFFIIPDAINIFLLIFGIFFAIFQGSIVNSIIGGVFGFVLFWAIAVIFSKILKQEALGFGDVKLLGVIGIWIGIIGVIYTIFFASFLGSVVGIGLIIASKKNLKAKIPFGPFLAASAFSYIFFGKALMHFFYGI